MKLERINASELSNADLNERELCRLLGGAGEPGCCQCGCHYSATTATNNTANNTGGGLTSDPGAQPCDCSTPAPTLTISSSCYKLDQGDMCGLPKLDTPCNFNPQSVCVSCL